MVICEGFSAATKKVQSFHQDPITPPPVPGSAAIAVPSSPPVPPKQPRTAAGAAGATQESDATASSSAPSSSARFRSEQIVNRMKMFFFQVNFTLLYFNF